MTPLTPADILTAPAPLLRELCALLDGFTASSAPTDEKEGGE